MGASGWGLGELLRETIFAGCQGSDLNGELLQGSSECVCLAPAEISLQGWQMLISQEANLGQEDISGHLTPPTVRLNGDREPQTTCGELLQGE